MKLLALQGSPRKNGNTSFLLDEYLKGITESNPKSEITKVYLQGKDIHYCNACSVCHKVTIGKCVIKDDMQELYAEFIKSEMIVCATPVYWWGVSAQLKTFLDRLNAFDVEGENYFKGKKISVLLTYGIEPPNKGPELIEAGFKEICKYTEMNLIDVYGVCSSKYSHIKEDTSALNKVYEMGLKITL